MTLLDDSVSVENFEGSFLEFSREAQLLGATFSRVHRDARWEHQLGNKRPEDEIYSRPGIGFNQLLNVERL